MEEDGIKHNEEVLRSKNRVPTVNEHNEEVLKLKLDQERTEYNQRLATEQEEREPYSTKPAEKMGLLFFIFAMFFCVIGDLIDFFTGGTIGWLIGLFIDGILALMFGLSKAGRKQFKRMAVGLIGESFPIIATLPLRTIFLIWSFVSSHSKMARKAGDKLERQTSKAEPILSVTG